MSLNANSPIPLYRQLALRLREHIDRGEIGVSEKIPSEHRLAQQYGIGRPTVRQATDLLVREGVLQRRRGSGTFVLPPARRIDLFSLAGTSAALRELHLPVTMEMLTPQRLLSGLDRLPGGLAGKPVYELRRLSRIEGEPVLLENIYLDAGLFAGLERFDLRNTSLARLAREHFFLEPTSAEQDFEISRVDGELAARLEVEPGCPLLKVCRVLHFGQYPGAIYAEIFCRTERYRFSQTITTPDLQGKEPDHAE
jgi:GntR family transcriptional regulator